MLGFDPQQRRKPQARAQAQAQAQNAAPDSIPGMFKPGEFVLPPDTVHAMGGKEALQGVVDATHTPVNPVSRPKNSEQNPNFSEQNPNSAVAAGAQGFDPQVFFANGGSPEDQLRQRAADAGTGPGDDGNLVL